MKKIQKNIKNILITILIAGGIIMSAIATLSYWKGEKPLVHSFKEQPGDYVVLLHGLGNNLLSMELLGHSLSQAGYTVINVGYPSLRNDIPTLSDSYVTYAIENYCTNKDKPVHFVTHSMGGILAREYMNNHPSQRTLGRIVMLAPPNQGSEVADFMVLNFDAQPLLGPAGSSLTTTNGIASQLGPVNCETAVIMGNKSMLPFTQKLFNAPNDGLVAVERAAVDGMSAFTVIDANHSSIVYHKNTFVNTRSFLETGKLFN